MSDAIIKAWMFQQELCATLWRRMDHDERGEGVISAAIAVLIMAFLGVGLWLAFHAILGQVTNKVSTQVSQIGA